MDQLKEDIDVEGVTLPEGVLAEIDAIHLRYPIPQSDHTTPVAGRAPRSLLCDYSPAKV